MRMFQGSRFGFHGGHIVGGQKPFESCMQLSV